MTATLQREHWNGQPRGRTVLLMRSNESKARMPRLPEAGVSPPFVAIRMP